VNIERLEWVDDARATATAIRRRVARVAAPVDIGPIEDDVRERGDDAVLELTNRFDATDADLVSLRVEPDEVDAALVALDPELRASLELAIENVRAVADAQTDDGVRTVDLPQGQTIAIRQVPVGSAGVYVPGGRGAYPSSLLMCVLPAQVAGVERIAVASPPGADGRVASPVLAAAALCEMDEIYAMGGAQAVFALAYGTETIPAVDVVVGPGNAWVQEAKRSVYGTVGIDSYAGPSEVMVVVGADTDVRGAALDLCAQAEHGAGGVLVLASTNEGKIDAIATAVEEIGERPAIEPGEVLSAVLVPSAANAIDLANALAPEHLELLDSETAAMADQITTAGCIFTGPFGATAFGDYVAGSNHVLPTGGAGRFSGPLGPDAFRRKIATVQVPAEAAAELAPHVKALAEAEGFPVHGESAMIRARD